MLWPVVGRDVGNPVGISGWKPWKLSKPRGRVRKVAGLVSRYHPEMILWRARSPLGRAVAGERGRPEIDCYREKVPGSRRVTRFSVRASALIGKLELRLVDHALPDLHLGFD